MVQTPDAVEFKVSRARAQDRDRRTATTDFANHGEYVSAMGGGSVAAQKCVGMPIVSDAPKTPNQVTAARSAGCSL